MGMTKMAKKKKKYFIGVDLGGTKILIGLLDRHFRICEEVKLKVDAHKGERPFMKGLLDGIDEVLDHGRVSKKQLRAIGIGCPGMITLPEGIVQLSPNISFLKKYPLRQKVARALHVPVIVENDVNAGLYGEQQLGAAQGYNHVVGIFLGTGVGGGLILNGQLFRGASGAAGELGHMFLSPPSFHDDTAARVTIETQIGRLQIASEAALLIMKQQAPALYKRVGFDAKKIKSGALARSIQSGDASIRRLMIQKARLLGVAMASIVNLLSPELFVLGGGLMEAMPKVILPEANATMKKFAMSPLVRGVKVVPAQLKDYSIVKGAAKLASDSLMNRGRD